MPKKELEQTFDKWNSVDKKKPEAMIKVLAYGTNSLYKGRVIMAEYIPKNTIDSNDFLDDEFLGDYSEYDDEKDIYWVKEGWWESSEESDTNWKVSLDITHWMSLPAIP